jgi:hypothetical protein
MGWSPDYNKIFKERQKEYALIANNDLLQKQAREYYKTRYIEFIEDWCITIDPRNAGSKKTSFLPFILFPIQKEFCHCLVNCVQDKENLLCEKSRDMGVTWLACAMSVWYFLFFQDVVIGWGSRKEMLVDRIGDPDSIFEKMRKILESLPFFLLPYKFDTKNHSSYMKIINPENHSVIRGEAGDNIGRGGRSLIMFKDESSYYIHADKIEAALGDNTNTQVDISSVQGTNTLFYQKRMAGEIWVKDKKIDPGKTRVFIMDWHDHPSKDDVWYNRRKDKAEREGTLHLFHQEVDRDYRSSVEGIIIRPEWIDAAINAHKKINIDISGEYLAALDVADEGIDKNAMAFRKGNILQEVYEWSGKSKDVGITAQKAMSLCLSKNVTNFQYDAIGIGAGVKSEINRLKRVKPDTYNRIKISAWVASSKPIFSKQRVANDNDSPRNEDFFKNLKIQAWWKARILFEKTYRAINALGQEDFEQYNADELISIDANKIGSSFLFQLKNELSQAIFTHDANSGKLRVEKKPDGAKSPNIADAIIMSFCPVPVKTFYIGSN